MNARHMARIAGFIVLLIGGLAAVPVLDGIQYLHWEMPVFAAHSSRTEAGMTVERAIGPGYEVTGLRTKHDRYMDVSPIWRTDTDCTKRPEPILRATRKAVFHRHSAEVTGYDDGIEGVWVANCMPQEDGTVIVYAIAAERNEYGLSPDSVSAECVTLSPQGDGYVVTDYADATDSGRNFHFSPENGGYPFPQYIYDMWTGMSDQFNDAEGRPRDPMF